jgi:hypothetical protein
LRTSFQNKIIRRAVLWAVVVLRSPSEALHHAPKNANKLTVARPVVYILFAYFIAGSLQPLLAEQRGGSEAARRDYGFIVSLDSRAINVFDIDCHGWRGLNRLIQTNLEWSECSKGNRSTKGHMPDVAICPCQHCNGHIQFDAASLSKENDKIACPHCGLETILFIPPPPDPKMQAVHSPPPPAKTAKPEPLVAPQPVKAGYDRERGNGAFGKNNVMKNTNILLAGILAAMIFIGISKPSPIVLPPPSSSVKWEYKVEACEDDSSEMREYQRTHPNPNVTGSDFSGEFDLMRIRPDGGTGDGTTAWELCAWFLEPKAHPKLILIFKRPVG